MASEFARKLNQAKAPVKIMVPLKGWSSVDAEGNPTYDPDEDRIFVNALRDLLDSNIEIVEVDANMEDPLFSEQVTRMALEIF